MLVKISDADALGKLSLSLINSGDIPDLSHFF